MNREQVPTLTRFFWTVESQISHIKSITTTLLPVYAHDEKNTSE